MFNFKFNSLNKISNGFSNGNYKNPCNLIDCAKRKQQYMGMIVEVDNILDSSSTQQQIPYVDPLQPLEPIITVFFEDK